MSVPREIIERYPLSELSYIVVSGMFSVLYFPYSIFNFDFSNGIKLPYINDLVNYLGANYTPFVNVQHIFDDFVLGFTQILLLGFLMGVIFLIFSELLQSFNQFISSKTRLKFYQRIQTRSDIKHVREDKDTEMKFGAFQRKHNISNFLAFLYSIRMAFCGLFHAVEVSFVFTILFGFTSLFSNNFENWLNGFYLMVIMLACAYFLHIIARRKFDKQIDSYFREYKKSKKQTSLTEF